MQGDLSEVRLVVSWWLVDDGGGDDERVVSAQISGRVAPIEIESSA